MGLSNYIPNSRISQAGVVADTADRPATPFEGQLLYQRDTNQLLVYDGSAWVMIADTDQPPGLQLVKTHSFTNVASTQVVSCFSSEFTTFRIVVEANANAGSSTYGFIYLLNGTTPITTNYNSKSLWSPLHNTSRTFDDADVRTTQFSVGPIGSSTIRTMAVFDISTPNTATATSISGNGMGYYSSLPVSWITAGINTNTTAYDGFEFGGTANITGTIRVYGYRNS